MKVSFESSYKPHQSGTYNPPTAAVIMEHGVQFQHHGVKNQHWGIKNGPPYPLTGENKQKAKASYKKPPKNPEKEGDYKPESSSSSGGGGGSSKSTKERKDDNSTKSLSKRMDKLDKDYDDFDRKIGDRDEWDEDEGNEWDRMENEYSSISNEVKKAVSSSSKYKEAAKRFADGRGKLDKKKFISEKKWYEINDKLLEDAKKDALEMSKEFNNGVEHKRIAEMIRQHLTDEYFKRRKN